MDAQLEVFNIASKNGSKHKIYMDTEMWELCFKANPVEGLLQPFREIPCHAPAPVGPNGILVTPPVP